MKMCNYSGNVLIFLLLPVGGEGRDEGAPDRATLTLALSLRRRERVSFMNPYFH